MKVIKYNQNNVYTTNVFMVVNDHRLLSPLGLIDVKQNQLDLYLSLCQATSAHGFTRNSAGMPLVDYDLYTVELDHINRLYAQIDGQIYDVFANYNAIVANWHQKYMRRSYVDNDTVKLSVLSRRTRTNTTFTINRFYDIRQQFIRSQFAMMNLVNIAVPKNANVKFFIKSNSENDAMLSVILFNEATYNLADFNRNIRLQGEIWQVRNLPTNQLRITMIQDAKTIPPESPDAKTTIELSIMPEDFSKLAHYCIYWIDDRFINLQFVYNPNRVFDVLASKPISGTATARKIPALRTNYAMIISADLLAHATALGINRSYNGQQYIAVDGNTITLEAVTTSISLQELQLLNFYDDAILRFSEFNGRPAKINAEADSLPQFGQFAVSPQFGNLNWFLMNQAKILQDLASPNSLYDVAMQTLHVLRFDELPATTITSAMISAAMSDKTLPFIADIETLDTVLAGEVSYKGITYSISNPAHNGKQFAVVLSFTSSATAERVTISTVSTANHLLLVVTLNAAELQRAWLLRKGDTSYRRDFLGEPEDNRIRTITAENGTLGQAYITFDMLRHLDLYVGNYASLLPMNVIKLMPSWIQMSFNRLTVELPTYLQ